jgi:ribosomal-protein-alanine N-acetyltransferase
VKGVTIRGLSEEDLPALLDLERELFPEDAWSEEMFRGELAEQPRTRHYVIAESEDGGLVGYAGLCAVAGEGDVQTIGVRPAFEGRGIGTALLTNLISEAETRSCAAVFLEVRADNERAQKLYERFGFEAIGVRKRYYQPSGVDAIVMRKAL